MEYLANGCEYTQQLWNSYVNNLSINYLFRAASCGLLLYI